MGRLKKVKQTKNQKRLKKKSTKKPAKSSTKKSISLSQHRKGLKRLAKTKLPKKLGRPPKKKKEDVRAANIKKLELDILASAEIDSEIDEKPKKKSSRDMLEQIMFRLPCVLIPLIGTPKQVQEELDGLAKKMQKRPSNNKIFDKIHFYMHGYLVYVVLKKFPFIRGFQSVDIYQETLIALRFKAIPNFRTDKGMSFLNFAKMCIRRHLITLLNASKNRIRDKSMNEAISLDSSPLGNHDEDGRNTYANLISDKSASVDEIVETSEAYEVTKKALLGSLSDFEKVVLREYLASSSYKEISKNISENLRGRYDTKSIDNALLRIRKKAIHLRKNSKTEDLPIFMLK